MSNSSPSKFIGQPRGRLFSVDQSLAAWLITSWLLMIFLINPSGDFPLNDDWVYAKIVRTILNADLHFRDGGNANFVFQGFWGAAFCWFLGFSFNSLRLSTLVLGAAGIVSFYGLARKLQAPPFLAVTMTATLMSNPFYLGLAHTFMTDVPFTAMVIISLLFSARYFAENKKMDLALGFLFAFLSLGIRQYGLIFIFALSFACMIHWRGRLIPMALSFTPFAVALRLQTMLSTWLHSTGSQSNTESDPILRAYIFGLGNVFSVQTLLVVLSICLYLGLLLLPFAILLFDGLQMRKPFHLKGLLIAIWATCCAVSLAIIGHFRMPLLSNVIGYFGMGPLTLRDTYILGRNYPDASPGVQIFWEIASMISILGGLLLLTSFGVALGQRLRLSNAQETSHPLDNSRKSIAVLLLVAGIAYGFAMVIGGIGGALFDRYLLPLYPLTMITLWLAVGRPMGFSSSLFGSYMATTMVLGMATMSVLSSHDYLSWNRTRWQAIRHLTAIQKIDANRIDGGYEFNGLYTATRDYIQQPGKSWWYVNGDDYVIASGPLPGRTVIGEYPVPQWLPLGPRRIVILQRNYH